MTLVLVVDDDPTTRARTADSLVAVGYRVRTVPDGRSALDAVDEERPDAVVSDAIMPGVDGWSLAARLRMRTHPIPVVLMSGCSVEPPVSSVRVLARPIAPADLCAAVADAIA
jgi:CheY-like chemotaxis protein